MTEEQFIIAMKEAAKKYAPANWREGQAVFNYIDDQFCLARVIQFKFGIDCFYDSSQIDSFLSAAYKILSDNCCLQDVLEEE